MRRLKKLVRDYGVVIVSMLAAGLIIGCASIPDPPAHDLMRNWNDPPPVKEMPNWIKNYDHSRPKSPRCA